MGIFIFACVLALLGVLMFGGSFFVPKEETAARWGSRAGAVFLVLLFGIITLASTYTSVGPREVGVQTSFGRLGKPLQSGVHFVSPWTTVTVCPLNEEYSIQNGDPKTGDALYDQSVPIVGSDKGTASVDVQVGYHIDSKDVDTVYRLYKCDLTTIREKAVSQRVRSDVAQAAAQFVSTDLQTNYAGIEKGALGLLQDELGRQGITIDSVTLAGMKLSDQAVVAANNKVAATNALGVASIRFQQAQIDKQTALTNAEAEQAANAAKSQSLTQAILCQQFIQAIAQSKITVLNGGGPCSAAVAGGSTSVLVPAK